MPPSPSIQTIPARHGTATFVPRGCRIKVINTYGSQVVGMWAFALGGAPQEAEGAAEKVMEEEAQKNEEGEANKDGEQGQGKEDIVTEHDEAANAESVDQPKEQPADDRPEARISHSNQGAARPNDAATSTPKPDNTQPQSKAAKSSWSSYVPSLPSYGRKGAKPAADATATNLNDAKAQGEGDEEAQDQLPKERRDSVNADARTKATWGSYMPSMPRYSNKSGAAAVPASSKDASKKTDTPASRQENGGKEKRTWASYFPSGTSFTSYLPDKGTLSAFAASHHRDPSKSYAEQLYEFSKTPVGAASLSAATGSGTASSLYAAYTAYTRLHPSTSPSDTMEYLSLPHTRASTQHLVPLPSDTLVSNLRNPLLTLVADTTPGAGAGSPGSHDALLPACDPHWYRERGVERWFEHGSCAENVVVALGELNARAGLRGRSCVGADVCVDNVPQPLNLFMHVGVGEGGRVEARSPKRFEGGGVGRPGEKGGYVVFRAERDAVVVLSACPDEVSAVCGGRCMVAHFVVEGDGGDGGDGKGEGDGKGQKEEVKRKARKPAPKLQRNRTGQGAQRKETQAPKAVSKEEEEKSLNESGGTEQDQDDEKNKVAAATQAGEKDVPAAPADSEAAQTPKTDVSGEQKARKKPRKLERRT